METFENKINNLESHLIVYAAADLMSCIAECWQVGSERDDLNVITYINSIDSLETKLNVKANQTSTMKQWMVDFHDDNMLNMVGSEYRWVKYCYGDQYAYDRIDEPNYGLKLRAMSCVP